ncbi:MAG: DUF1501 domain-containing protein [Cytophagaceae bacterium]|nr:DUF1501 domain-containing protein [Cytophagaceae bacterium]MBL0302407.1 DUF1501 domain-containing protein [Cytophagaceae bacterium]
MKRRDFIKNSMTGLMAPVLLDRQNLWGMGRLSESLLENDKVLVVIQLNGGNDGLNTIIPVNQYANYLNARKNIAIAENKVLKIGQSDQIGLHPSLKNLTGMFAEGQAGIIQDVGYPNPNYSHFRATDIWNTASDSNEVLESGWAGRYLAMEHPNFPEGYPSEKYPDPLAIQIGSVVTTALQGPIFSMGMSISDTANFYNLIDDTVEPAPNTLAGKELSFIRKISSQTNQYASTIKAAALKVSQQKEYPNLNLANQLKIVARLIAGGLKTKIYYVKLSGFDTHSTQAVATDTSTGTHANLLAQLADSIKAFQEDLKFLGVQDRVMGMTYSEFGRRIKSNASLGTDHGAAAPLFYFGAKVNSRYFGKPTTISATVGNNDNIPMQYDFRAVYASIFKYWFCVDSSEIKNILFDEFEALPITLGGNCGNLLANEPENAKDFLKAYPNPFSEEIFFKINEENPQGNLQIYDLKGFVVIPEIEVIQKDFSLNLSHLPTGIYFAKYQNVVSQKTVRLIKR